MNLTAALICLAQAVFFEARGEPFLGKVAVASVVMNRTLDKRFPDNVCDVVKQGPTHKSRPDLPIRHRCQFSFYCDGKSDELNMQLRSAQQSVAVAYKVLAGHTSDVTYGATFYHASYVQPTWSFHKKKTIRIHNHFFYKWEQ
jgi:spore germination cell wall hydrolase CwlJ-like protein